MPGAATAILAGVGLLLPAGQNLFGHNLGLWQYDKNVRQNAVYAAQDNALSVVGLWRDDLRDLFDITNTKMDNYTMVSTFVMGFALALMVDYSMEANTPPWLFFVGSIHVGAGFGYSCLAMVFSMYASVYVQQFQTKTMTEIVRLPIPDANAVTLGSANGRAFENASNVRTMFRVPVVSRLLPGAKDDKGRSAAYISESPHMKMFQSMEEIWMPLANFARISMICSLICISYGLIFYFIDEHMVAGLQLQGSIAVTIIMSTMGFALQRLDFMLSGAELWAVFMMHFVPPVLATFAQAMAILYSEQYTKICAPVIFFLYGCWSLFLLDAAHPTNEKHRSKFRLTVLHEMQFGKTSIEETVNMNEVDDANGSFYSSDEESQYMSNVSDLESAVGDTPQQKIREEVRAYHRTAARLLAELQRSRGNWVPLEDEFKALSRWAMEPENPALDAGGIPNEGNALDPTEISLEDDFGVGGMKCVAGHALKEKKGQTVFHAHGRFCSVCRRDLDRKELRYTCRRCTKYDVCPGCATNPSRQYISQAPTRAEQQKVVRMLENVLRDLRKRIPKLDDCKNRPVPARRRGSFRSQFKAREQDDAPLQEELSEMLPDPIKQDKLDEAMNADACQNMHIIPWNMFASMTSAIWFAWLVGFAWSIADLISPHNLGRPDPSVMTEEWNTVYKPDRRLSDEVPALSSGTAQVADWLLSLGHEAAANASLSFGVDGKHLRFLDKDAWVELGVTSPIDHAEIRGLLAGSASRTVV